MIGVRRMFRIRRQRLTIIFPVAGQPWQSYCSLINFRAGCPEVVRHLSHCRVSTSNFTTFDTRQRSRHHQHQPIPSSSLPSPSPHYYLMVGRSFLLSSSVVQSKSFLCKIRFSTNASSSSSSTTENMTPPTASVVASSLRRLIKPFLLKCHPDIQQQHQASKEEEDDDDGSGNSSISQEDASWAKAINLRAIQNLNSYLDSIQTLLQESSSSSSIRRGSRKNDSSLVEIDFVIAIQSSLSSTLKSGGKKRHQSRRNRGIEWHQSRRKVQLVLPNQQHDKLDNVKMMAFLERHVHSELVRLLRVAGLEVPLYSFHLHHDDDDSIQKDGGGQKGANDSTHPKGPFWHDAGLQSYHFPFGDGGPSKKSGRVSTTSASSSIFSRYKANREQFVRETELDNNSRQLFQHAMAESLIEDETRGLIANDTARRQDLIARILAKVQIQKQQEEKQKEEEQAPSSSASKNDDTTAAASSSTNSLGVVVVNDACLEQLLAMRRLSLVLDDNFQVLQLEELGRLWENLTLVLLLPLPMTTSWDDDNDKDNQDHNASTATARCRMRRTKRRRCQQQQHGKTTTINDVNVNAEWMDYAWTLHPDWSVTMHIPMDFDPDELVQELERNVQDFNRLLKEQTYHHYHYYGGGAFYPNNHDVSSSSAAAASSNSM